MRGWWRSFIPADSITSVQVCNDTVLVPIPPYDSTVSDRRSSLRGQCPTNCQCEQSRECCCVTCVSEHCFLDLKIFFLWHRSLQSGLETANYSDYTDVKRRKSRMNTNEKSKNSRLFGSERQSPNHEVAKSLI